MQAVVTIPFSSVSLSIHGKFIDVLLNVATKSLKNKIQAKVIQ